MARPAMSEPLRIVAYDPEWPTMFDRLAKPIRGAAGDEWAQRTGRHCGPSDA
jgi:GrpB-like predicted nucleotidyltransferase (UPF0157 family)